jgi:predicted nucleic acid-binding protein
MTEKHYFADTSFLIDLFKGEGKAVEIMEDADSIATGSTVLYELSKISEFDKEAFTQNQIIQFNTEDAEKAADMYRKLSGNGEKIGEIDYLIAAQAANSNRKLITRDKDFQKLEIETRKYQL